MTFASFVYGLIALLIGVGLVMYTEAVLGFAGRIYWAEKWLGTFGGTRLAIKLIGIITIILGFLLATGLLGPFMLRLLGNLPIFGTIQ